MRRSFTFSLCTLLFSCQSATTAPDPVDAAQVDAPAPIDAGGDAFVERPDAAGGTGTTTIGPSDRRARLIAPSTVTAPAPLLVLLHGYGANAALQDAYLGVSRQAASRGLYVLLPEGTTDASGKQFWNAPGCCDFAPTGVDDVAYLRDLVDEAIAVRPIDPDRVYFFGHSNGGFMSYHLGCVLSDRIAAIAVLAGSDAADPATCTPTRPISVLHLHGTADATIPYAGGNIGLGPFPGAVESIGRWAGRAGCDATPTTGTPIDLESTLAGAETTPSTYGGCDAGLDVQLLTITGGSHIPTFGSTAIGPNVLDWLLAHHR